jgi:hypothetical protein
MRRRRDAKEMSELFARARSRGWTVAETSRRSGIPIGTLNWWSWRLRGGEIGRSRRRRYVEMVVRDGSSRAFEVVLRSGTVVRVPASFESEALARLISVLDASC